MNEHERNLKIEDVAKVLNCAVRTVQQLIYDGELTAFKVGNRYRIPETNVREYIKNHTYKKEIDNNE